MSIDRTAPDPVWLDAQYDNRARIPEHAQIFERWLSDSAAARAESMCRLDIPYGDAPGEMLDIFPAGGTASPVFVFIHGGWWRAFDKRDHSFIAPPLVRAGAMVVLPNYALCPAVTIDAIVMQMVRALVWTWRNAARHGGDPRRIVVAGHSAGGHLAAMLLACDWQRVDADLPPRLVHGALAISGLYDLEPLRRTPFLNVDLRLTPQSVNRSSPANLPPPGGPLFALVGALESDEFLRQNALIRTAWGRAVVPVCEQVAARHHLDVLDDLTQTSGRIHALALQLLGLT